MATLQSRVVAMGLLGASSFLTAASALLHRQPGKGGDVNDHKLMLDVPYLTDGKDTTRVCEVRNLPWAEDINTSSPPDWWVPEGSAQLAGQKIAIAFRGDYHRFSQDGFSHCPGPACSDYWVSQSNIEESIRQPLIRAGAEVRTYFHTYNAKDCVWQDNRLIGAIQPAKYSFDAEYHNVGYRGLSYTYIEAMKLVVDDNWADHVVMIRFDVQYVAPITNWNLKWGSFNYVHEVGDLGRVVDFVYIVPASGFTAWLEGLNTTSRSEEIALHMPDTNPIPVGFMGLVRNCSDFYFGCGR